MCKGNNTTTTSSAPNPQAGAAYSSLLNTAQQVASTPYTPYTGELVAPVNTQQQAGIANVNQYSESAQPYINEAQQYQTAAATPITQQQIQQYESPYTADVVNSTQAQFNNQNAQQLEAVKGNAIAQGALGGNREAIAEAETTNQQQLAQAPVIAGLENQGYQTGLNTALTEQQAQQGAAYGEANLGVAGENAGLTGANAQVGAGSLEQSTQQAQDTAAYQQFLNQLAYPFQTTQWLSGIDTGVGSQMGGTSETTAPAPSMLGQILGGVTSGVGALGGTGAFGSAGWLTAMMADGGSVGGRANGGVANVDPENMTIPETMATLKAQQHQLVSGHRRAMMFPNGTHELPLPRFAKRTVTKNGVFHYNPARITEHHIHHASSGGRENDVLDLGPYSKGEIMSRLHGGEIPIAVVERHPDGTEVRAAAGTHRTAMHQLAAMERTKSPGHSVRIEDPRHTLSHRIRAHHRAMGGIVPGFDTGGAAGVMPYSGGSSFIPNIAITHGVGAPRPPQAPNQQGQGNLSDQAKQIGQLASQMSNKNNQNQPQNIAPQNNSVAPVGTTLPIGDSPESFSPTDYSGSAGAQYKSGGVVPTHMPLIRYPKGFADGGAPDDFTTDAPASGVLPAVYSPPTQPLAPPQQQPAPSVPEMIASEAKAQGVDPGFVLRQASQESGGRQFDKDGNIITSRAGAQGVGQLMPGTARDLGVDPTDPKQNIHGMVSYDRQLLDKYGGDPDLAAAAYNAGPGRVDAYLRGEKTLPAETVNYVSGVNGHTLSSHGAPKGIAPGAEPISASGSPAAPSTGIDWSGNSKLWPSLMAAGFGMMASRSPFPGVAIGEGGLTGLQTYSNEAQQEREAAFNQSKISLESQKLSAEMQKEQDTLNETTKYHAGELGIRAQELHKPIVMFNKDGSQVLVDPTTGQPMSGQVQRPGTGTGFQSPLQQGAPGQGGPQAPLKGAGGYTLISDIQQLPEGMRPAPPQRNEDYLKTLDPQEQQLVQNMADYKMNPGNLSMRVPHAGVPSERERVMGEAMQYDPAYDQTLYPAKQKAVNDFLSGTSPNSSSTVMLAGNTAIQHASEMYDLVDQIKNLPADQQTAFTNGMDWITKTATANGIPWASAYAQYFKNSGIQGTPAGEALARWNDAKQRYSEEVTKFYSGGNGSEAERDRSLGLFDPSKSPEELKGAIAQDMRMLYDKVTKYNERLMNGLGPAAWVQAVKQDPNLVTVFNSSRDALNKIAKAEVLRTNPNAQQQAPGQTAAPPAAASKPDKPTRFKQLIDSGMSKQDAYTKMYQEGY